MGYRRVETFLKDTGIRNMFLTASSLTRNRLLLVAPADGNLKPFTGKITPSNQLHAGLLADLQRLRGRIYLEDGAISRSDLTEDGRHLSDHHDEESWHLLLMTPEHRLVGCTRFRQHLNTVRACNLGVAKSPLAASFEWSHGFNASLGLELETARAGGFSYVEVGGWALDRSVRGTAEALTSVLATFAWSRILGGALGISTATERNGSASILRRLGGKPLEWDGAALPAYFDEKYNCMMEVLRFDSREPNPKYAHMIQNLADQIAKRPIVCPASHARRDTAPQYSPFQFNGFKPGEALRAAA